MDFCRCEIDRLPTEILDLIVLYVSSMRSFPYESKSAILNMLLVNRQWYQISIRHLWRNLHLVNYPFEAHYRMYQRLFDVFDHAPDIQANFQFIKELSLQFYHGQRLASVVDLSGQIIHRMRKQQRLVQSAINVTVLSVSFDPITVYDSRNQLLRSRAREGNEVMIQVASSLSQRYHLERLELSLGRPPYRFAKQTRRQIQNIIDVVRTAMITHLTLSDPSLYVMNTWLTCFASLSSLTLELHRCDREYTALLVSDFWKNIDRLKVRSLKLHAVFSIPYRIGHLPIYNITQLLPHLEEIFILEVDDCINLAQFIFSRIPNLQICRIENEEIYDMDIVPIPFEGEILSTSIHTLSFRNCLTPINLIHHIERKNAATLTSVSLPCNASDEDLDFLTRVDRNIRFLDLQGCKDLQNIVFVARLQRLVSLNISWFHLAFLDSTVLHELLNGCPLLETFGISLTFLQSRMSEEELNRDIEDTVDDPLLKEWLGKFLRRDTTESKVEIDLRRIRKICSEDLTDF